MAVTFRGHRYLPPAKLVFLGYLSYVLAGWSALCLPWSHHHPVRALDNLFISSSAVSTTGLTTISIADDYTFLGQFIVMALIQLGGIGYMTFSSFVILARKQNFSTTRSAISQTIFSLPASFHLGEFIKSVIWFTLAIESVGAIALYLAFRHAGIAEPLWIAVFHSVSSFCTAGFGLYNNSFESFSSHFWINFILSSLSYLGAIGFIVCLDFWRMLTGKSSQTTLTTKIILWATAWLTVIGTSLLFLTEPSIRSLAPENRLLAPFFQCMTAMTTVGFNTIPIADLSKASLVLIVILMIIGSSPSGTGGGVKVTTITAMLGVMKSTIASRKAVSFAGREIPVERIMLAFANLGFYLIALTIGVYLLELTESTAFEKNVFEAASALGTVGLSMGITSSLTPMGKIIIILLMFCGRVGPLTFGAALWGKHLPETLPSPGDNDLAV